MKKILFLETKEMYASLGFDFLDLDIVEFDGMKYYKKFDSICNNYKAVVSFLYHSPMCNYMIYKAKQNNIKTFLIFDGIFDMANSVKNPINIKLKIKQYYPILHDYLYCVGEDECLYFESENTKTEQITLKRILNKNKIEIPSQEKFLITTANTPYFDIEEKNFLIELIKKTINALEKKKIDYIYRIFDQSLIEELKINEEKNFIQDSFEDVLKKVTSVITTPSSIILSCMYHKRNVGMFIYRDFPLFIQGGWLIHKSTDIENTVLSMLEKNPERIYFQNYQINKYVKENEISILDDIIEKVDTNKENQNLEVFLNQNLENLINSKLNFNFEFIVRKLYRKILMLRFIKK